MNTIKSFNGIRVIAFSMIFMSHLGRNFTVTNLFCFGTIGVQFFFILSGFLCFLNWRPSSYNIIKESWLFYLKKLKKFYPLHILTFLMALCLQLWWIKKYNITAGIGALVKSAIPNLLLIQSFFKEGGGFNQVTWFLSTILFLYFLTPVIVRGVKKITSAQKVFIGMVMVKTIQVLLVIICPSEESHFYIYIFPFSRVLDYVMGVLLGALFYYKRDNIKNTSLFQTLSIFSLCLLMYVAYFFKIDLMYTDTLLFQESILLILFFSASDVGLVSKILGNRVFAYLATISMEIFLFHQVVIITLEEYSISFSYLSNKRFYLLSFIITLLLSIAWKQLEKLFSMK